jgi:plastocyanin
LRYNAAENATPRSLSKLTTLTLAIGLIALAGCGESTSSPTPSTATTASVASTPTASSTVPMTSSTVTTTPSTVTTSAPTPRPSPSAPANHAVKPATSSAATSSAPAARPPAAKPKVRPAPPRRSTSVASTAPAPASAAPPLSLEANPEGQLKYNKASLTAKAGKVSIAFTNTAPLSHNLTVASSSGVVVGATPTFRGGSKTLTVSLKPGAYKFYCSVPGHRMAGMEGTLTVG